MDLPIERGFSHKHKCSTRHPTQSDPDLQTARFQGRNSGNGCSAARFLRRNTNLESGTASTFILCAAITKYNY